MGARSAMKKARMRHAGPGLVGTDHPEREVAIRRKDHRVSGFRLVLEHLTTAVEAVGADVVTQVRFASGRLDGDAGHVQGVVRAVHAALGGGLFVLLDGHDGLLKSVGLEVRLIQEVGCTAACWPQRNSDASAKPCIIA
jgi:hypothetical protein